MSVDEVNKAEIRVLELIQATSFSNEILYIKKEKTTTKKRFSHLSPFSNNNGLIRIGNRLKRGDATFAQKHPILLPKQFTDHILREIHETAHHAGVRSTLYSFR